MNKELIEKIKNSPKFQELVSRRNKLAWSLSAIILIVYYAFISVIAFDKSLFGQSLSGGVITVGIPVGIGVILVAIIITGIYTKKANDEFDALNNEIKKEFGGMK